MKVITLFSFIVLLPLSSAWATGVGWSELKHCDQGYSLVRGESWSPAQSSSFYQVSISGVALKSLNDQLGRDFTPTIDVTTPRFGYFLGKVGELKVEAEEHGKNSVSFNVYDKNGERVADYQFYNCR